MPPWRGSALDAISQSLRLPAHCATGGMRHVVGGFPVETEIELVLGYQSACKFSVPLVEIELDLIAGICPVRSRAVPHQLDDGGVGCESHFTNVATRYDRYPVRTVQRRSDIRRTGALYEEA